MTGKSLKAQKNGRLVGSLALPANEEKMSARDWGKLLHVSLQLLLSQDFDKRRFQSSIGFSYHTTGHFKPSPKKVHKRSDGSKGIG